MGDRVPPDRYRLESSFGQERSILVIGVSWPLETFLARLLRGLLRVGFEVTVASDRRPDDSWSAFPNFHWLPAPSWSGNRASRLVRLALKMVHAWLSAREDLRNLARHVDRHARLSERLRLWNRLIPFVGRRWDAIYFPWNSAAINHLPLFEQGNKVVVSCRGAQVNIAPHNPKRSSMRKGLALTFRKAAVVHCVSEHIQNEAVQFGLDSSKANIIRPAVDPSFFCPPSGPKVAQEVLSVVTTGSLIWRKGYEYLLQAVHHLVKGSVPVMLSIIGDGPERQRLLFTVHDLDLTSHVNLLGRLPPEEVRDHLQQAHVFVLASLSEGIANAALEAMACGLPVVTTDCGGMREAVTNGVEGFLVPVRDSKAIARPLEMLIAGEDLRARMGQAARARVLDDFTIDVQVQAFAELFRATGRPSAAQVAG